MFDRIFLLSDWAIEAAYLIVVASSVLVTSLASSSLNLLLVELGCIKLRSGTHFNILA